MRRRSWNPTKTAMVTRRRKTLPLGLPANLLPTQILLLPMRLPSTMRNGFGRCTWHAFVPRLPTRQRCPRVPEPRVPNHRRRDSVTIPWKMTTIRWYPARKIATTETGTKTWEDRPRPHLRSPPTIVRNSSRLGPGADPFGSNTKRRKETPWITATLPFGRMRRPYSSSLPFPCNSPWQTCQLREPASFFRRAASALPIPTTAITRPSWGTCPMRPRRQTPWDRHSTRCGTSSSFATPQRSWPWQLRTPTGDTTGMLPSSSARSSPPSIRYPPTPTRRHSVTSAPWSSCTESVHSFDWRTNGSKLLPKRPVPGSPSEPITTPASDTTWPSGTFAGLPVWIRTASRPGSPLGLPLRPVTSRTRRWPAFAPPSACHRETTRASCTLPWNTSGPTTWSWPSTFSRRQTIPPVERIPWSRARRECSN
mmetsp:Transcript_16804/g.46129  ORF Transcript_16804/g.46129 Transcript_16804/m.46129 type:complete len:423 (-) Transcript_16804:1107-2375(-)